MPARLGEMCSLPAETLKGLCDDAQSTSPRCFRRAALIRTRAANCSGEVRWRRTVSRRPANRDTVPRSTPVLTRTSARDRFSIDRSTRSAKLDAGRHGDRLVRARLAGTDGAACSAVLGGVWCDDRGPTTDSPRGSASRCGKSLFFFALKIGEEGVREYVCERLQERSVRWPRPWPRSLVPRSTTRAHVSRPSGASRRTGKIS